MDENDKQAQMLELFREETNDSIDVTPTPGKALHLRADDRDVLGAEFVRQVGKKAIREYGYAITGVREKDEGFKIWFDEVGYPDAPNLSSLNTARSAINRELESHLKAISELEQLGLDESFVLHEAAEEQVEQLEEALSFIDELMQSELEDG